MRLLRTWRKSYRGDPTQRTLRSTVDVHTIDAREHPPAELGIDDFVVGKVPKYNGGGVCAQFGKVVGPEGRGGADDVPAEADIGGTIYGKEVGAHHVLEIDPAIQKLIGPHVGILIGRSHLVEIVSLGKEPGRAQHDAGSP